MAGGQPSNINMWRFQPIPVMVHHSWALHTGLLGCPLRTSFIETPILPCVHSHSSLRWIVVTTSAESNFIYFKLLKHLRKPNNVSTMPKNLIMTVLPISKSQKNPLIYLLHHQCPISPAIMHTWSIRVVFFGISFRLILHRFCSSTFSGGAQALTRVEGSNAYRMLLDQSLQDGIRANQNKSSLNDHSPLKAVEIPGIENSQMKSSLSNKPCSLLAWGKPRRAREKKWVTIYVLDFQEASSRKVTPDAFIVDLVFLLNYIRWLPFHGPRSWHMVLLQINSHPRHVEHQYFKIYTP